MNPHINALHIWLFVAQNTYEVQKAFFSGRVSFFNSQFLLVSLNDVKFIALNTTFLFVPLYPPVTKKLRWRFILNESSLA